MAEPENDLGDLTDAEWLAELAVIGEDKGYFEKLGPDHSVLFAEESPKLLVSFQTFENARGLSEDGLPYVLSMLPGWSHLIVLCNHQTWFRDPCVYGYFDRLVDDGFLEDFDQVVFLGAGSCGYAAAAFSVAAPGARVLALEPQATLEPLLTGWDPRFRQYRRLPFGDRYGFAPDMIEAADGAVVIFDPANDVDAMHAALFHRAHVRLKQMRLFAGRIEASLVEMALLAPLIEHLGDGSLDDRSFAGLVRARRSYLPYLRALLNFRDVEGRQKAAMSICRHTTARRKAPRFRRRLAALEAEAALATAPPAPSQGDGQVDTQVDAQATKAE